MAPTQVTIECVKGDIANQPDIDAVVNAANAQLRTGGGVAGALHRAAGPGLAEECRPLAPIKPGQAVISGAHNLPNRHVIHCLGPVYGVDEPSDELLAACYRNALILAEEHELTSVAFPSLSTGAFGYPMKEATRIALSTVIDASRNCQYLRLIRFVLFDDNATDLHRQTLEDLQRQG
ncbi:Appr-1-p processing protein [Litchfieldella qijiaojingensis]|uniref:Appr-1-p processing protein n=1 Tax=Litchfieldella qijiaojingensis TaxID=980347 RepID=A0ABQ2Z6B3_9GAMM|nr:macro domain-containing protein [Halomonas qijiaojingensis]GGY04716.1 Appr-1-p processing protein [Halomonas qijiaojingensis]